MSSRILIIVIALWAGVLTAQTIDGNAYSAELTRIAEQAKRPGAYKGKIAIEFANHYNATIKQFPTEKVHINALTNRVADDYNLTFTMNGETMESAQFGALEISAVPVPDPGKMTSSPATPEMERDTGEVFEVVDEYPRFPGCEEHFGNKEGKLQCSQQRLTDFIEANLKYPDLALRDGIEGTVVVDFTVNRDGSIDDIQVTSGLGYGCDEEALRLFEIMNYMDTKWIAGMHGEKPVRVHLSQPVQFKLQ